MIYAITTRPAAETMPIPIRNLARYATDHHNGRRFRNIWGAHADSDASKYDPTTGDLRHKAIDVAGWLIRKGMSGGERGRPATVRILQREVFEVSQKEARVTWLGHAACLVQCDGLNIITDPVFGDRVSPVKFAGPRRLCPLAIAVQELPHIDAIILSHNHYDHAESETLKFLAARDNPPIYVPLRVAPLMRAFGFSQIYELDWWQQVEHAKLTVTCLPAKHFSGRSATDRNETLWASFMIEFPAVGKRVYFAGDTAYSPHFSEIAAEFPDIDTTFMPIGAYLPRWFMREVHVSPDESIRAFQDLRATTMLGIHWGTYDLADEDWDEPQREAIRFAAKAAIEPQRVKIIAVGEHYAL